MAEEQQADLVELSADIVSAYVSNDPVSPAGISELLASVFTALKGLSGPTEQPSPDPRKPPVSIKKSITPDHIVSLEDGKPYKSLKRHLAVRGLTPAEYRTKWGLPADYPMVAPNYAEARSQLAKQIGLGRRPASPPQPTKRAGKRLK